MTKGGARNTTAARALLKAEELELTDEGVKGLDEQLKAVKEQNPYLFEENTGGGNPSFSKPGNPNGGQKGGNVFESVAQKYEK